MKNYRTTAVSTTYRSCCTCTYRQIETLYFKRYISKTAAILILRMKLCAEDCCGLCFTLFSVFFQETLCREDTKPKPAPLSELLSNNVSHTVLPLFFFFYTISCQDFHFMCHTICGSASLHVEPIFCELMSFAGGWSCCVLQCSGNWEQILQFGRGNRIVTEGTDVFGSMFTFGDIFYDHMFTLCFCLWMQIWKQTHAAFSSESNLLCLILTWTLLTGIMPLSQSDLYNIV